MKQLMSILSFLYILRRIMTFFLEHVEKLVGAPSHTQSAIAVGFNMGRVHELKSTCTDAPAPP